MPLYQSPNLYAARAKSTAGQSISNSTTDIVIFGTEDYDLSNSYNPATGEYTCQITGYLKVSTYIFYQAAAYAGGERAFVAAFANGSQIAVLGSQYDIAASGSTAMASGGSGTIPVTAGDVITVRVGNNRTAGATLLNTNATTVWASFEYVR